MGCAMPLSLTKTAIYGVCCKALDLLHINCQVLSGDNHNPMMVEHVNRYLTKGLKIMTNECDSGCVALEAILLLLYAWNSCPIPGTDISWSLVAVGREFAFPIDYSTNKHWELTSSPISVESYSMDLAACLSALCKVTQLLVQEHRACHCELINSPHPNSCTYSIGDIVFAHHAIWSDASKECVDKPCYQFTGPWQIILALKGASYKLEHCSTPNRKEKKHASDLSPYPLELIPFQPLDGPDTQYGQIHKPITAQPFKEAGINEFQPTLPYKVPAWFLTTDQASGFHWPSLLELNDDLLPFPWSSEAEHHHYLAGNTIKTLKAMHTGLPPSSPEYCTPTIPPLNILTWSIIQSSDKLFFISNSIGSNDACKWCLVWVAFQESISWYPSCLQDGRFLVEFYICHLSDSHYHSVNQRFWLHYHTISKLQSLLSSMDTHLTCPSDSSDDYATCHKLLPFQKWLNLTHQDTFIHGPFDFASVNGCKTWDRISQSDWDILKTHCNMFHNPLPCFDVPSYSIHVDCGAHESLMMLPLPINYLFWELSMLTHQVHLLHLDKRSLCRKQTTPIFWQIQMCLLEVWHAEVGTVFAYFV